MDDLEHKVGSIRLALTAAVMTAKTHEERLQKLAAQVTELFDLITAQEASDEEN